MWLVWFRLIHLRLCDVKMVNREACTRKGILPGKARLSVDAVRALLERQPSQGELEVPISARMNSQVMQRNKAMLKERHPPDRIKIFYRPYSRAPILSYVYLILQWYISYFPNRTSLGCWDILLILEKHCPSSLFTNYLSFSGYKPSLPEITFYGPWALSLAEQIPVI